MKKPTKSTVTIPAGLKLLQELANASKVEEVPEGWMTLGQIAKTVGVTRSAAEAFVRTRRLPPKKVRAFVGGSMRTVNIYDMRGKQ